MERDFSGENSWRLALETSASGSKRLSWSGLKDGQQVTLYEEPDVTRLRRMSVFIFKVIPEDLL